MVDVSDKPITRREATARGTVRMSETAFGRVRDNTIAKGDVLAVARLAGIGAAKRTAELIPLCHSLPLDGIEIELALDDRLPGLRVEATARVEARTGVEMEALSAVSAAALTVYDMCKSVDREMEIGGIRLELKKGGRSGTFRRGEE